MSKERYLAIDLHDTTYKEFFEDNFKDAEFDNDAFTVKMGEETYDIYPISVENFDIIKIVRLELVEVCDHLKFISQGPGKPVICAKCGEEL